MKVTSTLNKHASISIFGCGPKALVLFLLIMALGAGLRGYDLGAESYWVDEIMIIHAAGKSLKSILFESWRPPVYPLLAHSWIAFFGTTEEATRSLSAIAGIASLAVMYVVAHRLFGTTVGLITMFLMAISEFLIYHSQDCRPYAFFTLMTLLSFLFYIRAMTFKRRKDFAFYGVTALLMLYTHTYGAFVLTAQVLYLLYKWAGLEGSRMRWLVTQILILIGIGPASFLVVLQTAAGRGPGMDWIPDPPFWTPLRDLLIYLFHRFYYYYSSPSTIVKGALPATAFFLLGMLFFVIHVGKKKWLALIHDRLGKPKGFEEKRDELILVVLWLLCPILIPFAVSKIVGPFYLFRYTVCATPAFFLLLALGIVRVERIIPKGISLGTLVLLIIPSLHYYYVSPVNEQWREAAAYIAENAGQGDAIATVESFTWGYTRKSFCWYYRGPHQVCAIESRAQNDTALSEAFTRCVSGNEYLWLLFRETPLNFDQNFKKRLFEPHYSDLRLIKEKKFEGVSIYLFSVPRLGVIQ